MSNYRVDVVPVVLEPHPNAEKLALTRVFGWTCCVQKDWPEGQLGAFIPPDSVVDTKRPEFSFLGEHTRIKVKKLRGIVSQGLLIPAPAGSKVGDDVKEILGVVRYQPPENLTQGGEDEPSPDRYNPHYDVEVFERHINIFNPLEPVIVTEKIHGTSARYCFEDGRMRAGSRVVWKKHDPDNIYWKPVAQYPGLEKFCQENQDCIVYGEVYGYVQDLHYGLGKGQVALAIFDILKKDKWMDFSLLEEMAEKYDLPLVPLLSADDPFDINELKRLTDGKSLVRGADNLREGIVIKPRTERTNHEIGRVQLKLISNAYLERA